MCSAVNSWILAEKALRQLNTKLDQDNLFCDYPIRVQMVLCMFCKEYDDFTSKALSCINELKMLIWFEGGGGSTKIIMRKGSSRDTWRF